MKLLPLFVKLKIRHQNWAMPTLWLPIVLLWPIFFILLFAAFLVGFVVIAVVDTRSMYRFVLFFSGMYLALCELRGTKVDVEDHENQVLLWIT